MNCKCDGTNSFDQRIIKLIRNGEAVPICPELLAGMSIPRNCCEIKNGRVIDKKGNDLTKEFKKGAKEALRIARMYKAKEAILKSRSPSCGSGEIYSGNFDGKTIKRDGITAKLFKIKKINVRNENEI